MLAAIKNNDLPTLMSLYEGGGVWNAEMCDEIAKIGNIQMLEYAHKNGCPWTAYTCAEAASNGHFDCVRYAHENGCALGDSIISMCIAGDADIDFLKYIVAHYQHEMSYDTEMLNASTRPDYLKYLHEELKYPLNETACEIFASVGCEECLKYAIENECPWDKDKCLMLAIRNHNDDVVDFIKSL